MSAPFDDPIAKEILSNHHPSKEAGETNIILLQPQG
jgi:hypothetical protein